MASRKLNVLVYAGPGSTIESVKHAIYTLRRLLSPNYAVIPVTDTVLLKEPWAPTCALLVFPGGADLGYCRVLNGEGNGHISRYVRAGGAYLGFCAGAYYASKRCEFEVGRKGMEVIGSRKLAFFPGTCRGGAFRGFRYHSEEGARAVRLVIRKDACAGSGLVPDALHCYYNGGGVFVLDGEATGDVEVLASYADPLDVDGEEEKAALILCKVGLGRALLTGPHPEFAAVNLSPQRDVPGYEALINTLLESEDARIHLLKACLGKLGLEVTNDTSTVPSLSRLHLSSVRSSDVNDLLQSWEDILTRDNGEDLINGDHNIFHLEKDASRWSVTELKQALPPDASAGSTSDGTAEQERTSHGSGTVNNNSMLDSSSPPKHVVVHGREWPAVKETPYFNHHTFYSSLQRYRRSETGAEEWGDYLMYGEVVNSTNTLLDENPKLLSKLPTGFTLTATTQVAGRGRGSNVWVSPSGALIMSTVVNHPSQLVPTRPIVLIQYLAAIAIVEAIKSYDDGYAELPVKLKWPNDIYALDPTKPPSPPSYVKIGGILSKCVYSAASHQIVLGIGINTNNERPTTSLDAILPSHLAPFRIEKLLARILTRLEVLYKRFVHGGFSRDMEAVYYSHWLHGGQTVTLESAGGVRARIVGITRDWGMLRAEELGSDERPTGKMWALQSDENSFDFFRGLVKRKL